MQSKKLKLIPFHNQKEFNEVNDSGKEASFKILYSTY
jgi:hypothetical protein